MQQLIRINLKDNVAVAVSSLKKGEVVKSNEMQIIISEDIGAGQKVAVASIAKSADVIKYGFPIGLATCDIAKGEWVHTHNVKSRLGDLLDYQYKPNFDIGKQEVPQKFSGYKRSNGKVGIRNEVWIIPTVGCVNAIAKLIEDKAQQFLSPQVDGIFSYSHPNGCSQLGDDHLFTQKILSGLINHPNAGAVLVLGLGCENNQIADLKKVLGEYDEKRVKFLVCQEYEDEVSAALEIMKELCTYASQFTREVCTADKLVVGLKCGGSDGFSGITANPLVGQFSNRLTDQGGTSILTEVPEMFGAETLLMNRCISKDTFTKTVNLINDFKKYFMRYGEKVNENPSPGNKAGGITTLEDKSLGCVQKGGTAPVTDVLSYGDRVQKRGLNLLMAPGNDLVASTALAAAGANLILFTTGRGTPFGCPVPTVKIASNSQLASRKAGWIDFDAGKLLSGMDMQSISNEFFAFILEIADGSKKAKSESLDKRDLAIFKDGVTL
ncbi:MAG: altronate dehydratase [Firmicutes bacterium]|nr:altronate dehydratase [Bacillota bacterium]